MTSEIAKGHLDHALALLEFRRLVQADAVLFHTIGLLKDLGLEEFTRPLEMEREKLATRLQEHMTGAYAIMPAAPQDRQPLQRISAE